MRNLCYCLPGALVLMAAVSLVKAQSNEPEARVQQLYAEAKTAQAQKDLPGAIAKYEEILKVAPKLAAAYNNLGSLYFQQRDYAKASAVLEHGLKLSPSMTSASALLGISLYEMGEFEKARAPLEAAIHANPNDNNANLFLARDLVKAGDLDAALSQLTRLTTSQPRNQEIWYMLAKLHMKLSERALAQMNQIDSNSVLSHQLSAEVMESMNNFDGAVVELKKAVELAPETPGNHYKLGDAYWNLSQWDSAAEQFRLELAVDPLNCSARWKSGNVLLQKNGDTDAALADLNQALTQCPGLAEAKIDRARALIKLNRSEDAVADLQAAVKATPDDPGIHFLLAKVYRTLGKSQEAAAEMQTFSKLDESARAAVAERAQEVIKNKETAH